MIAEVNMRRLEPQSPSSLQDLLFTGAKFAFDPRIGQPMWNVRAVEFICKPGKIREVHECIRGPIADLLRNADGFSNAMILHSHGELRRVLVLSFWETEEQARANRWEDSTTARKLVSPLIDVCARVETYEAILPEGKKAEADAVESRIC
jgi:hypothetical protein